MRSFVFAVLAVLASGGGAEAKCLMSGYPFQLGMNTSYKATCDAEGTTLIFRTGLMRIESVQIVETPSHGRAGVRRSEAAYLPAPGYHGKDHFMIRVCSQDPQVKGCTNVTVDVTVP